MSEYIIENVKKIKQIFREKKLEKVQLIITSPPYFDILNYENNNNQIGYGQSYYEYLTDIINVFQDCFEISKNNASLWIILDTFRRKGELQALPFDINHKLKERFKKTWKLMDVIIWDKEKNIPWNAIGRFKNEFEYILFFSKNNNTKFNIDTVREINDLKKWWMSYPERYNPKGKAPSNIWRFTIPIRGWGTNYQNHLCPFPFPLVEKIIAIASDKKDLILDPFAGSGSVLAIADLMNRRSIGIDINKNYKKLFENEVLIGARKYWKKRSLELQKNTLLIKDFKSTNLKLRKLKVASIIGIHINTINKQKSIFILMDKDNSNEPELYILKNSCGPKIDLKNEKIKDLIKQAKIYPKIIVFDKDQLTNLLHNLKLNKYKLDKFYKHYSMINISTILNRPNPIRFDFLYSNIHIKVS